MSSQPGGSTPTGQAAGPAAGEPKKGPERHVLTMWLGIGSCILSYICCLGILAPAAGIPAILMARKDLQAIEQGTIDAAKKPHYFAGLICGIIGSIGGVIVGILNIIAIIVQLASK